MPTATSKATNTRGCTDRILIAPVGYRRRAPAVARRAAVSGSLCDSSRAMLDSTSTLAVLGCGTMGEAIVRGLLRSGRLKPQQLYATDRRADVVRTLRE